jgi:hypothetical protein
MQKPAGVAVLAVLYWVGAFFCLLMAGAIIIGLTSVGVFIGDYGPLMAGFGTISGLVFVAFAAACAFIGYGLFQLQEWARTTAIVLSAIGIVVSILGLFWPVGMFFFGRLFKLVLNAIIIWYLTRPQVRTVFRPTT